MRGSTSREVRETSLSGTTAVDDSEAELRDQGSESPLYYRHGDLIVVECIALSPGLGRGGAKWSQVAAEACLTNMSSPT